MAYEEFAGVYDLLNEDADYDALFAAVLRHLQDAGIAHGLVLDLGCGTGELSLRLAQAGYEVIAVDVSEEMLSILREKAEEAEQGGVMPLHQDILQLDLYGTVAAVVSTFDTLNHIGPLPNLQRAMERAGFFLEQGGLFVFDMNTPYKHKEILANNTFTLEAEDGVCIWGNSYDSQQRRTEISLRVCDAEGELFREVFCEYSYTQDEIIEACTKAGFAVQGVQDGECFTALTPQSERFLFVAEKICQAGTAPT